MVERCAGVAACATAAAWLAMAWCQSCWVALQATLCVPLTCISMRRHDHTMTLCWHNEARAAAASRERALPLE